MDDRGRLRFLHLIARLGRATREEVVAFRDAQLRRLVAHAHARVPHYRRRFDEHGVRPQDIGTAADLTRLPMTSRRELQSLPVADVLSRDVNVARLVSRWTSGSSGRPMQLYWTPAEKRVATAIRLRMLHDLGIGVSDRQAGIAIPSTSRRPSGNRLTHRTLMRLGLLRRTVYDISSGLPQILAELQRTRPDVVMGYPSILVRLGALVTDAVRADWRPRIVLSGAEALTALAREQLTRAFGAEVRDWYGAHEFGMMGWECPRAGAFHIAEHGVVLEILADGRPAEIGESGEVVVTALHGFAMPFIRYRLGDIVVQGPAPCPCGAPFSTIRSIEGRTRDTFFLGNGRVVHPNVLNRVIQNVAAPWTRQFQLIQERRDRVVVKMVRQGDPARSEVVALYDGLVGLLGPGIDLELQWVSDIPPGANGKFALARSLVPPEEPQEAHDPARA